MTGEAIWIVGVILLLWIFSIQSGKKDDAFGVQRLTSIGRSVFASGTQPTFQEFDRAAGVACRSAGVSPVAAYYGMRMMVAHGGITADRVAILLQ